MGHSLELQLFLASIKSSFSDSQYVSCLAVMVLPQARVARKLIKISFHVECSAEIN